MYTTYITLTHCIHYIYYIHYPHYTNTGVNLSLWAQDLLEEWGIESKVEVITTDIIEDTNILPV